MNDRLAELRLAAGTMSSVNDRDAAFSHAIQQQLTDHMNRYNAINESITAIDTNRQRIIQFTGRARTIASTQQRKELLANVDAVVNNTQQHAEAIKRTLDELKYDNDVYQANSAMNGGVGVQARKNLYNQNAHKFRQSLVNFNQIVGQFREQMQKITIRGLTIANNNLTESELNRIIDSGQADAVIQAALLDSGSLHNVVNDIQERQNEIHRLEQQILNIAELFKDLQVIVDLSGETIDRIDHHVDKARNHVQNGEVQLNTAARYQSAVRKRKCIVLAVVLCVLIIFVAVIAGVFASKK